MGKGVSYISFYLPEVLSSSIVQRALTQIQSGGVIDKAFLYAAVFYMLETRRGELLILHVKS